MVKISPTDRQSRNSRQKRRSSNVNDKYLKPGALAQLRNSKASQASKHCTDLGKKRVAIIKSKPSGIGNPNIHQNNACKSPVIMSPVRFEFGAVGGLPIMPNQSNLLRTPKTPCSEEHECESRLESLPFDLLVKILCHLHHDQLRPVFHVSQKIRKAVIVARQYHFNFTTPDRARQELLNTKTPLPTEHWPFLSKGDGGVRIGSAHTPKAPRHGPHLPSRVKVNEMKQIAAVLFVESSFNSNCLVPSVLSKPICKSLASNRVLFYEGELCQAVAQNKLR